MPNPQLCPPWAARLWCRWAVWSLACFMALPALGASGITSSSYFEDKAGRLTLDEVRARPFTTFEFPLQKGYSDSAFWVRLTLSPSADATPDALQVLRIRPGFLDEIALHDPMAPGGQVRHAGDRHPLPQAGYVSLNHNFTLPASSTSRDIWLRVKTSSATVLHADVLPLAQAARQDIHQELIASLLLGLMVPLLLIALVNHGYTRDTVSFLLILNQLAGLLYCIFVFGFMRTWLDGRLTPAALDWGTSAIVIGAVTVNGLFNLLFVKECRGTWRPMLWAIPLVAVSGVNLILFLAGHVQLALSSNIVCVVALPAAMLLSVMTPSKSAVPVGGLVFTRWQLLLMYVPIALLSWTLALPLLGVIKASPPLMQLVQPGYYFVSAMVAVFGVVYRTRNLRRTQEIAQARLHDAEREAALQRQRAQDQNRLLSMLTHEIRTPLSLLRIAVGWLDHRPEIRTQAETAIQDLNEVINGVSLMQRIENKAMVLQREALAPAVELTRLAQAQEEHARIRMDLAACPPAIHSDRLLVRIILRNLLDNALRYSPDGSLVQVAARGQDREGTWGLAVTVTNAIDESAHPEADRMFTQFYRGPGSHRRTGSGLGLFIAKELATTLGGDLSFTLESATSIRFSLWLPL